jgi:hypothetical protein
LEIIFWGFLNYLPRLPSNHNPPDHSLPISQNYGSEPKVPLNRLNLNHPSRSRSKLFVRCLHVNPSYFGLFLPWILLTNIFAIQSLI